MYTDQIRLEFGRHTLNFVFEKGNSVDHVGTGVESIEIIVKGRHICEVERLYEKYDQNRHPQVVMNIDDNNRVPTGLQITKFNPEILFYLGDSKTSESWTVLVVSRRVCVVIDGITVRFYNDTNDRDLTGFLGGLHANVARLLSTGYKAAHEVVEAPNAEWHEVLRCALAEMYATYLRLGNLEG